MSENLVSHIHVGKCKKVAKLDAQMTKELQKAAKAKEEKIAWKINNEKVLFKGKKEVIIRKNIEKTRKNKVNKIVVIAAKTEKKDLTNIYAMKFASETSFNRFCEALSADPSATIVEKQLSTTPAVPRSLTPTKSVTSITPRKNEPHDYINVDNYDRSMTSASTSVAHESPIYTIQSNKQSLSRTPSPPRNSKARGRSRSSTSSSSSSSSSSKKSPPRQSSKQQRPRSPKQSDRTPKRSDSPAKFGSISTYITTDVLNLPKRAGNSRTEPKRDKSNKLRPRTEVKYLNYVPGKGMIKSNEGNVYLYSSRIRNDSTSLSSSSLASSSSSSSRSSSSSSSTSTTDIYNESVVYRLVPVNGSNGGRTSRRSRSRKGDRIRASTSSSSSSTTKDLPKPKINVWQYRDLSADSTSSSSSNRFRDVPQRPRAKSHRPRT